MDFVKMVSEIKGIIVDLKSSPFVDKKMFVYNGNPVYRLSGLLSMVEEEQRKLFLMEAAEAGTGPAPGGPAPGEPAPGGPAPGEPAPGGPAPGGPITRPVPGPGSPAAGSTVAASSAPASSAPAASDRGTEQKKRSAFFKRSKK